MTNATIPLFPLNTVLFPGGELPLRIFEPRYLSMVAHCVREETCFGIVLIESGREVGGEARTHAIGTLARIVDWCPLPGNMLGISVRGEQRFRILAQHVQRDYLQVAEVSVLSPEPQAVVPPEYEEVIAYLDRSSDEGEFGAKRSHDSARDASWVGFRLAEYLAFSPLQQQLMLELRDPIDRLERLMPILSALFRQKR
ncbi:MAG: LON peptidase substrate-binding domain-containing protein [Pseudomonadota bacterium]|nr:LON peptidase substrate-binding domain-containing protein [Pseudomonadota bacterium]